MCILFQHIWEENASFSFNMVCFPFLHSFLKILLQTFCFKYAADYICMKNAFWDIFSISQRNYNALYVIIPKQIAPLYPLPSPFIMLGKTTQAFGISESENHVLLLACFIKMTCFNSSVNISARSSYTAEILLLVKPTTAWTPPMPLTTHSWFQG